MDFALLLDEVLEQRILQLTAFFPEEYEPGLMERIPGSTSGRWHTAFTDITAKGADKGEGLLRVPPLDLWSLARQELWWGKKTGRTRALLACLSKNNNWGMTYGIYKPICTIR